MTEQDWLACADPEPMLEYLRGKATDRKLRLFAVACCRSRSHWFVETMSQNAIRLADAYAEGQRTASELLKAFELAWHLVQSAPIFGDHWDLRFMAKKIAASVAYPDADDAAWTVANDMIFASGVDACGEEIEGDLAWQQGWEKAIAAARQELARLLREILNPFAPIKANRTWLTSTVVSLAEAIYAEQAFDRLPILADALEEAGCDSADMLNHCRQRGEHVRGCWVTDLLLGKK